uniref:Uncharacterized protein n=1 Tax=Lactuca sativa TaxID=4236 RepID=A0A9R1VCI3_LACSA|nr:hypothetical protein LSAT_V11C600329580 [Lactuca sativa]
MRKNEEKLSSIKPSAQSLLRLSQSAPERHIDICHIACDYPNHQLVTLIEEDPVPKYDTNEDLNFDHGDSWVIQQVLHVVVSKFIDDDLWLRNNKFRTKCTAKVKVNIMITNGICFENVVSTYMV